MEVKESYSIFKDILTLKKEGFCLLLKPNAVWNLRSNYAASAFKKSLLIIYFSQQIIVVFIHVVKLEHLNSQIIQSNTQKQLTLVSNISPGEHFCNERKQLFENFHANPSIGKHNSDTLKCRFLTLYQELPNF